MKKTIKEYITSLKTYWQTHVTFSSPKIIAATALVSLGFAAVVWAYLGKAVYAADEKTPIINQEIATLILDDLPQGRNSLDNIIALENLSLIHWANAKGTLDAAYLQGAPTRLEGFILSLRLVGMEKEVYATHPQVGQALADLPDWGKPFAAYGEAQGMVEPGTDWLAPLTAKEYLTMLGTALSSQQNTMPLTHLQKYNSLAMNRSLLADISYHFLCLKEVQLNVKTGAVTSVCWGDRLVQRGLIPEKAAILADLPILQNDSYRYEKYFTEALKEDTGLFSFTAKNKAYMNKLMADKNSYWIFINKTHLLPEDFVPNLIEKQTLPATTQNGLLEPFVYEQMKLLFQGAKNDQINLFARSGYRSYQTQTILYGNGANPYRAKPGSSEHQTGLAMDVVNKANRLDDNLAQSKEALWLKNNAHQYGFIVRYPKEKEDITGYPAEWWHLRYVGKQIAHTCYVNHWTYDEFFQQCQQ